MTPTAHLALSWSLWTRQRWTTGAILLYAAVLAAACRQPFAADWRSTLFLASVPLAFGVLFLLAVFVYPEGDVAGRESSFPPDQLLLPVSPRWLVFWPMLYGTLTAAAAWLALRELILRPLLAEAPPIWPAAMLAAAAAVLQALLWTPMALPLARMALALTLVPGLLTAAVQAGLRGISEPVLCSLALATVGIAYCVAVAGVTRARRGEPPPWNWPNVQRVRAVPGSGHAVARPAFLGPEYAQLWYEWRTGALALPLLTVAVFGVLSAPLLWIRELTPLHGLAPLDPFGGLLVNLWLKIQVGILFAPPLLAFVVGFGRRAYHAERGESSLHPFLATRPLHATSFAKARLLSAALSAVATWLLVLCIVFIWLQTPARSGERTGTLISLVSEYGSPSTVILTALIAANLMFSTWLGLIHTMWADLSGRSVLAHCAALVPLMIALSATAALIKWGLQPEGIGAAEGASLAPWVLRTLWAAALVKLAGAAAAGTALHRGGHVSGKRLAWLTAWWALAAMTVCLAMRWMATAGPDAGPLGAMLTLTYAPICSGAAPAQFHSVAFLAGFSILFCPYSRLALIPLMLSANRHR